MITFFGCDGYTQWIHFLKKKRQTDKSGEAGRTRPEFPVPYPISPQDSITACELEKLRDCAPEAGVSIQNALR
jgi:hypothetical protein